MLVLVVDTAIVVMVLAVLIDGAVATAATLLFVAENCHIYLFRGGVSASASYAVVDVIAVVVVIVVVGVLILVAS